MPEMHCNNHNDVFIGVKDSYRGSGSSPTESAMLHHHVFCSSSESTNKALALKRAIYTFLEATIVSPIQMMRLGVFSWL